MKPPRGTDTLFTPRQSVKPKPMNAIEKLIQDAPDPELCRINVLAFAARHQLDEDDVIAAFKATGPLSAKLLKNGILKTYKDYPHGMITTQADVINADLLAFIKA